MCYFRGNLLNKYPVLTSAIQATSSMGVFTKKINFNTLYGTVTWINRN